MTILDRILARKRVEVAERERALPEAELRQRLADGHAPPVRPFRGALAERVAAGIPAVITEIKRASPSAGTIRDPFDPAWIAGRYAEAGAAALSVLTDRDFFGGDDSHLPQAREASGLPALRKDFVIAPYQVSEARLLGADCVLLIAAVLDDAVLAECLAQARADGVAALVEVHDQAELDRALAAGADLVGINNRDLHTFETDLATSEALARHVPPHVLLVSESGIHSPTDLARLGAAGIHAFLVGEGLMRSQDPGAALVELVQPVSG